MGRCGVSPDSEAVALARAVNGAQGLNFRGIMATVPGPSGDDADSHASQTRERLQVAVDARDFDGRAPGCRYRKSAWAAHIATPQLPTCPASQRCGPDATR